MRGDIIERTDRAISFRVDDVEPARTPLATSMGRDALGVTTGVAVEAASDLARSLIPVPHHGLIATAGRAFMEHRPLVLGPDAVWQAIAQGFADHVNADPEGLRSRLVPHEGRRRLVVPMAYLERSPENPWPQVFEKIAELVRKHSHPEAVSALDADFTTSGPVERVARALVLLDTFKSFFEYEVACLCGIPWVRLEGTPADWRLVRDRVERLAAFGLEWWVDSLRPVLIELERTALGLVNRAFWRGIFQSRDEHGGYGGPTTYVSGWIVRFAPYLGDAPRVFRNELVLGTEREVPQAALPRGFAQVPFVLRRELQGREDVKMVAFAGVLAMKQHEDSLALEPRVLWAVGREPERTR